MFKRYQKFLLVITTLFTTLIFTLGCSYSTDNNQGSTGKPIQENPETSSEKPNTETIIDSSETSKENEPILFEDPILFSLLKKELLKESITPKDLETYTGVTILADEFIFLEKEGVEEKSFIYFNEDAFEYDGVRYEGFGTIKTLTDLKYFKNLDKLNISLQPEIDYDTFPENILKTMRYFYLYQSKVTNISFLENAEKLRAVTLNTNTITDLSPLMGKESILRLDINWNDVEDLTPLSSLKSLKSFSAYGNKISDLTPLSKLTNLENIQLYQNLIKDISPLKEIKSLKKIEMINNQIEDVSPLKEFESFEELRLSGNPIKNINTLSHIENLEYSAIY